MTTSPIGHPALLLRLGGAQTLSTMRRRAARGAGPATPPDHKLGFGALVMLSVGSMAAGGIFTLPSNIARSTAAGPALIGWAITGLGMYCLSHVFRFLAVQRPDLDAGVYAYAKGLMGPLPGLLSAWGYWISAWIANLAYFVLLFDTLSAVVPAFGDGCTWAAIAGTSTLLWLVHWLVLRGVHQATFINSIATVAKIVPILAFVVLAVVGFQQHLFTMDFWGDAGTGDVFTQVRRMMLVTVWVFIGIEGASVCSSRARRREDIGRATVLSFGFMLALLVMVNMLSYGAMRRAQIAGLANPSLSGMMEHYLGHPGAVLVQGGIVISLLGAVLAWQLLCAETVQVAADDGTLPRFFGGLNPNGSPARAMWLTSGCMQVMMLLTAMLGGDVYLRLVLIATSMILVPYLFSSLFGWVQARRSGGRHDTVASTVAVVYSLWLLFAGGTNYLLLSSLLYLPGIVLHAVNRQQRGERWFTRIEAVVAAGIAVLAAGAVVGLARGWVSL